jgi:selenocysteine lyase/cysteine desulfurase
LEVNYHPREKSDPVKNHISASVLNTPDYRSLSSNKKPMQKEEIQQLRAATSGTTETKHFNNAGCSLPPDIVVDTVIHYLREEATKGGYETEAKYNTALENVYTLIAKLLNARTDEIAIVENASTAWHLAFNGIEFEKDDEVITSEMEYTTNTIGFLNLKKTHGIVIKIVPNDARGNFSMPAFEELLSPKTKLIAITHIPSTAGNILPVAEIGKIARRHGILYLLDACQSVGHIPIDVEAIGCDMLAVTGRKYLRAPRGTGFLYIRKEVQDRLKLLFMDGHSTAWVSERDFKPRDDARRFELYEKNRALTLGLGAAVKYALDLGIDRTADRIRTLATTLRNNLAGIDGVTVHDRGDHLSGIVTFSVDNMDSAKVKASLAEKNITVSIGKAVSTLVYMNRRHLDNVVRASVHYYNTEEEIESLCATIADIISLNINLKIWPSTV